MTTKHTPLPWHQDPFDKIYILADNPAGKGLPIYLFESTEHDSEGLFEKNRKKREGNARLLIRAVNSNAAMEEALQAVTDMIDAFPHGKNRFDIKGGIVKMIRAALTTAKGKKP